ncbi:MAG TPA: HepT-like ribonuclease domain-containing protein [Reyranella sp.]|nr:HepT-like ribonuclease domain-containing protein [Reyranella sp.]
MRRNRPADLLRDILDFIDKAAEWASHPEATSDEKTLYAVLHALQNIGEAVTRLPQDVTNLAPEVPWQRIKAMRNLIAHDYAGIDADIVWKTVRERLPELKAAATSLLFQLPKD